MDGKGDKGISHETNQVTISIQPGEPWQYQAKLWHYWITRIVANSLMAQLLN